MSGPNGQLPSVDPELWSAAKAAVTAIRGNGRKPNGQAGEGNTLALTHGLRSSQLLDQPDIVAWHKEQVTAICADLGGESELSSLARASVREAARLEVILAALGDNLLQNGVLTGKGKTRSATAVYLKTLDRFTKLAGTLGLARKAKTVPSIEQYLEQRRSIPSQGAPAPERDTEQGHDGPAAAGVPAAAQPRRLDIAGGEVVSGVSEGAEP